MSAYATSPDEQNDRFGSGIAGAILLHALVVAAIIGWAAFNHFHNPTWGESAPQVGSIQASMVSAIPLPTKAPPVKDNVLTPDEVSKAAAPPPKEAAVAPPKDTDVLIKSKTPPVTKIAPAPTEAPPKHPQPVPVTPKANTGEQATQIPQSVTQLKNGTSTVTVQDRAFGNRYAYYLQLVARAVAQNYYPQEVDAQTSEGKSVKLLFDIQRDGTVLNLRIETRSGSSSLDTAALRSIQRIDNFAPLPAGDHLTIEDTFDYHKP